MLQSKIKTALLSHNLCNDGEHILVAVSGGADSIAMLYLLHALAPELRLRLTVAHLNHGLRGAEADADADFVNATASRLVLPCVSTRTDIRRRADGKMYLWKCPGATPVTSSLLKPPAVCIAML